jgi:hypothetical protein
MGPNYRSVSYMMATFRPSITAYSTSVHSHAVLHRSAQAALQYVDAFPVSLSRPTCFEPCNQTPEGDAAEAAAYLRPSSPTTYKL